MENLENTAILKMEKVVKLLMIPNVVLYKIKQLVLIIQNVYLLTIKNAITIQVHYAILQRIYLNCVN